MASPLVGSSSAPSNMASDAHRHGRFSLQLGDGLKPDSTSSRTFSGVRYNHKPRLSNGSRKTRLDPSGKDGCSLKIIDKEGDKKSKYTYSGQRRDSKGQFVLLFDHAKQTATLERITSSYDLNLESTPYEASANKLKDRYPHIPPPNDAPADINGFLDGEEPDPNNPFDYRHFLKTSQSQTSNNNDRGVSRSPSPLPQNTPKIHAANSAASSLPRSPLPASSPAGRSPMVRQAKPSDILRPMNSKKRKVEASNPPQSSSVQLKPQDKKPTPSVRIERRASTRPGQPKSASGSKPSKVPLSSEFVHSSDDESPPPPSTTSAPKPSSSSKPAPSSSNALEIDLSASPPRKPLTNHRKILGATLGTPNQGPISLRSAASSPNARNSPLPVPKSRRLGPAEIDFGSDMDIGGDDKDEDRDAEGDEDVVPMSLGSPAHEARPKSFAEIEQGGHEGKDGDGVDDFEAELMQGFFDDVPGNAVDEDESDVSEAE